MPSPLYIITHTLTRPDGSIDMDAVQAKVRALLAEPVVTERQAIGSATVTTTRPRTRGEAYQAAMLQAEIERSQNQARAELNAEYEAEHAAERAEAERLAAGYDIDDLLFERDRAFWGTRGYREERVRLLELAIKIKSERLTGIASEANARLISAAPDLLGALQRILNGAAK